MPNKKSYIMSDEDENKDETGNVAINGNITGGNIVLTGYNAGSNEDCTFDNRGFQLETHDTSKGEFNLCSVGIISRIARSNFLDLGGFTKFH